MLALPLSLRQSRSSLKSDMRVSAHQDLGCLSRPKYIYRFNTPIPQTIIESFSDCDVTTIPFSKHVPCAKDLLKIRKNDAFQAEIIVRGFSAVVYFAGQADCPSVHLLDAFDQCLHIAGYDRVTYLTAKKPQCDRCPARHLKNCLEHAIEAASP